MNPRQQPEEGKVGSNKMLIEHPSKPTATRSLITREVARKAKSVDHFLVLWGEKAGYHLPPKKSITWDFIAQVLAGKKKLFQIKEIGEVSDIPKVKGVLVKNLWEKYKNFKGLKDYFPDISSGRAISRKYFFSVQ